MLLPTGCTSSTLAFSIVGKMDFLNLCNNTHALFINAILLSAINTAAATIFHRVTLSPTWQSCERKSICCCSSYLPFRRSSSARLLPGKFFLNDTRMLFPFAGPLVFASHAWLKVTQLYCYMDGANARGALEGHSGRNTSQI